MKTWLLWQWLLKTISTLTLFPRNFPCLSFRSNTAIRKVHRARVVDQSAVLGWSQILNPLGSITSVVFNIISPMTVGLSVVLNIISSVSLNNKLVLV